MYEECGVEQECSGGVVVPRVEECGVLLEMCCERVVYVSTI
jgi:hypothetical protein